MSRFARVQIGTVYLTHDGALTGTPARVNVENESVFASNFAATNVIAADGSVWTQTIQTGNKGKTFALQIDYLPESVLTSIVTALNTALANQTSVAVAVDSFVDFTINAKPVFQNGALFSYEGRSNMILRNVRLEFISV